MEFILRPWGQPNDAEDVAFFANNPRIARNLRDVFPYPYALSDARTFIQSCVEKEGAGQLCRAIAVDGRAVGSVAVFAGSDVYRKSAELGYWLAEPYWGNGIMPEAVRRLCAEAFDVLDVVRIYAEPYVTNSASRRVLEKAGFALEGILKSSVYKNDRLIDSCIYALLRDAR